MRIIGGEARGRRLFAPDGTETRPTADRTRESLFNILSFRIPDSRVIDLFGGTGALALEALSRGAAFAAVSDLSAAAVRAIERNAEAVLGADRARIQILRADYRQAIRSFAGREFDIVFLDPPYRMADAYADAASRLADAGMLSRDAVIVMEREKNVNIRLRDDIQIYDERAYRDTVIAFASRRQTE